MHFLFFRLKSLALIARIYNNLFQFATKNIQAGGVCHIKLAFPVHTNKLSLHPFGVIGIDKTGWLLPGILDEFFRRTYRAIGNGRVSVNRNHGLASTPGTGFYFHATFPLNTNHNQCQEYQCREWQ